ncbi:MAG TPA: hypothetical protein IGS31_13695 [Oscillatoriales cyanobacterium M4454_W2019_049]|nr:hypothetical protein [Oscillatoriales cyanobacterium M4454_W2019_049]
MGNRLKSQFSVEPDSLHFLALGWAAFNGFSEYSGKMLPTLQVSIQFPND